jgi:alpha-ketoglutaric semialdehyde dehydrogenase
MVLGDTQFLKQGIDRFLQPVCFQHKPEALLPRALRDPNPLGIWGCVDGKLTAAAIGLS